MIVYSVPEAEYHGLIAEKGEVHFLLAENNGRKVKSSHFELAPWGSGKHGSLLKNNKSNYTSIKPTINTSDKNDGHKLLRYINLGGKGRKIG